MFVPGPHGGLTSVHGGGNLPLDDRVHDDRSSAARWSAPTAGSWSTNGYVAGNPYGTNPQHVWVNGVSYTILGFSNADCGPSGLNISDPWPDLRQGQRDAAQRLPGRAPR